MSEEDPSRRSSLLPPIPQMERVWKVVLVAFAAFGVLAFTLGFAVAFGVGFSRVKLLNDLTFDSMADEPHLTEQVFEQIQPETLETSLKWISSSSHMTGQYRDTEIREWIRKLFLKYRFHPVSVRDYDVLLSMPDERNANKVELYSREQELTFSTSGSRGYEGQAGGQGARTFPPYHAYSPAGEVEGCLTYVNYAREEDFKRLKELKVPVQNCIAIARNGEIYRGNKVLNAQEYNAKALITYSDPEEVARNGESTSAVFPNSWWLPANGVESGTVLNGEGDPLTPGWASMTGAHRLKVEDLKVIPEIPSQPVSYGDARTLLASLGGEDPPYGWSGRLQDVQYKLGGEFTPESNIQKAKVVVTNRLVEGKVSNFSGSSAAPSSRTGTSSSATTATLGARAPSTPLREPQP